MIMKYFMIFILTFFVLISGAQDTIFNKLINSYTGSLNIRSIIMLNNNYYASISQVDTLYKIGYGILKIDSLYNIIDSSIYSIPNMKPIQNNGHGFNINKQDTSFIVAGAIQFYGNAKENGYLIKYNKDLDTLWTKQIAHPDTAYADTAATPWISLRDVKVTPSGDYIIVGNYNYHCQGNRNRTFIIKMDSGGGIIWYKFIDASVYTNIITSIELEPQDTGFYFISRKNTSIYLIKCDKNGNIKWDVPFNGYLSFTNYTEIKVQNNEVIVGSNFVVPPLQNSSTPRLLISKINKQSHIVVWSKKFFTIPIYSKWLSQETIDIEITPSGKILVGTVGKKYTGSSFTADIRAYLLMLNSQGDSLWSHYYTYQNDSITVEDMQFNDMVICDDGGILFGGSYYNSKESIFLKAWLVKTDSLGNAPGMFTVGIEDKNTLVIKKQKPLLYPNPATTNFNLRFEQSPKEDMQLSIFSVSGALVKQQKLTAFGNEYRVDIGELGVGVYFIKLESNGVVVYSGKFVKR